MKFGIPDDQVVDIARATRAMPSLRLVGIAAHIGSQVADPAPYAETVDQLLDLRAQITAAGITTIAYIDIGGGLAVTYDREPSTDLAAFADVLRPAATLDGVTVLIEPGRFLVADAGVLLTQVTYRKHSGGKDIIITDAGMNDLIRPSLYDAYHAIDAVDAVDETIVADIVGPVCESGDFFALDRVVPNVQAGDLLALRSVGAYGYTMASNYKSRPRPAEVLVDDGQFAVVTRRETYDDLIRTELQVPHWSDPSCA
jgi:diaminopimelate decarboxylase